MSKHNQYYRDIDFKPEQSINYTLLIQAGQGSFSYAVLDESRLIAFEENLNSNELAAPSTGNELLSANYRRRLIGLPDNGFTFVPFSLFKPELTADLALFLDVKVDEKVFSQPFDEANQLIYKVGNSITNTFDAGDCIFGAKGWISAIAGNHPANDTLYLNIDDKCVEVLNFRGGKLRFYNHFEFNNPDELVYFTSLAGNELQLQQPDTILILSGDVEAGDINYSRLAEFFQKIEFNDLKVVELPEQIPSHTILSLTALSLCGSSEAN